jgi:hypothetical protein
MSMAIVAAMATATARFTRAGPRYSLPSDNRLWHCRRSDPGGRSNEQHATVNDDGLTGRERSAHQALVRVSPIAHCQTESDGAEVVEII